MKTFYTRSELVMILSIVQLILLLSIRQSQSASLVHPYVTRTNHMLFASHNHTDKSVDQVFGQNEVQRSLHLATTNGFDAMVITEHIHVNPNTYGITNIIYISGMECSAGQVPTDPSNGYHITHNWTTTDCPATNVQACLNWAYNQGGIAIMAHPSTTPAWTWTQISTLSNIYGMEIIDSGTGSDAIWQSILLNQRRGIYIWSSYDHMNPLIARWGNYAFVDHVADADLKDAMSNGNFVPTYSQDFPRLELTIAVTNMTITVAERNGQTATWTWRAFPVAGMITNQTDIATATSTYTVSTNDRVVYVSALKGQHDKAWSQPFWVGADTTPPPEAPTYKRGVQFTGGGSFR